MKNKSVFFIGGQDILQKKIPKFISSNTSSIVLLMDINLKKYGYEKNILKILKKFRIPIHLIEVEAGESLKKIKSVSSLYGQFLTLGIDRSSLLIVFGGGTLGDVGGFVASTYLRGIKWIGIPTTLLAQVDSSIGGKTGINHDLGKNLIGSFYEPLAIFSDPFYLKSLRLEEIISGLGEIVKYALIFDLKFFEWLENNILLLLKNDSKKLEKAIRVSIKWKIKTISQDYFDETGIREVLNFGHTFGHALESLTHYKKYQHGEAIIWGMHFALNLSFIQKTISQENFIRIKKFLEKIPITPFPKKISFSSFLQAMKKDKKVKKGKIRFILLKKIGSTLTMTSIKEKKLKEAFMLMTEGKKNDR